MLERFQTDRVPELFKEKIDSLNSAIEDYNRHVYIFKALLTEVKHERDRQVQDFYKRHVYLSKMRKTSGSEEPSDSSQN